MRLGHDLVVVGASAGGLPALQTLLGELPGELAMAMLIVVHSSPDSPGGLADVLNRGSTYPVSYARDGVEIRYGHVYLAPPDLHLTTDDGRLAVRHGPRENCFRPAVDPLFRSAAASHGERVIAIVLSGSLDDGTHGLAVVKSRGGIAIVQSEEDALVPHMPVSAAHAVAVDYVLPASEMARVIAGLVGKSHRTAARRAAAGSAARKKKAAADPPPPADPTETPTVLTCPECGGALWELEDHGTLRYRCHVGHGMTSEGLAQAQVNGLEESLWRAARALAEHAELRRRMASRARKSALNALADAWEMDAEESERRSDELKRLLEDGLPRGAVPGPRAVRPVRRGTQRG
jgi:two-component system chemotaxis response regulator CheB